MQHSDSSQPSLKDKTNPARSVVECGPVKLTAEVLPAKARLSDEPVLMLTIEYETGVRIEKPPFGASLGSFVVRDFHEPLVKTRDGREIMQQIYTLEPIRTGRLLIDPISVTFIDLRPNGDEKTHTVQTESLSVEISSMVGDGPRFLADLRPQAGPLELPAYGSALGWSIVVVCIVLTIIGWLTRRHFKCKRAAAEIALSPEELALIELEKLVAIPPGPNRRCAILRGTDRGCAALTSSAPPESVRRANHPGILAGNQPGQHLRPPNERAAAGFSGVGRPGQICRLPPAPGRRRRELFQGENLHRAKTESRLATSPGGGRMMGFRFQDPLWLLLLIPLAVAALWALRRRQRAAILYSSVELLKNLPVTWRSGQSVCCLSFSWPDWPFS